MERNVRHSHLSGFVVATLIGLAAAAVHAVPMVSLHPSNVGIGAIMVTINGTIITIDETWTSTGIGALQISGLDDGVDYELRKVIHNNSGVPWTRLANELLDPLDRTGQDVSADGLDPQPQPAFVPSGFSTSNDADGLSFAQGSGLPRTSTVFSSILVDELSDARDFIDFLNGTLLDGATDMLLTYGLRDNNGVGDTDCLGASLDQCPNQPFLLVQRPNAFSRTAVPEPGTFVLIALGFVGLGLSVSQGRRGSKHRVGTR